MELTPKDREELWLSAIADAVGGDTTDLTPVSRKELWYKKLVDAIIAKDPADPEVVEEFVNAWLDNHPEATTTVEDGTVTLAKLADAVKEHFARADDVSKLESALNSVANPNLFVENAITQGKYIGGNGVIGNYDHAAITNNIPVDDGEEYGLVVNLTPADIMYNIRVHGYNGSGAWVQQIAAFAIQTTDTGIQTKQFTVPSGIASIRFSFYEYTHMSDIIIAKDDNGFYGSAVDKFSRSKIGILETDYENFGFDMINRFNPNTITENTYVNAETGELVTNSSFFASDYIRISDLDYVSCCKTHIVAFYTEGKIYLSGQAFNTLNSDGSIERPSNAYYMRFSTYKDRLSSAQIGRSVTIGNYVSYGEYLLPDLVIGASQIKKAEITVDAGGQGDYTSLTEALYSNVDDEVTIKVMPGTYDLHAEYIAKWGASAVDDMKDADESIFNGFQFGAIIRNKKIIFEAGSRVVCDYTYKSDGTTSQTVNGTHRICAFRVDYNVEIIGLDLTVAHVFYAIHDDYGLLDTPYTNKYENCRIVGSDITNANCIGGGCKKYSRHILNNCYFDNGSTWMHTARYHNTNQANAVPEVYVSNCYFNTFFAVRWYGTQTTKMKAYVNNCKAMQILASAETADSTVENVELHKWCNEETGY